MRINKCVFFLIFCAAILDFGYHIGFNQQKFWLETSNTLFLLHQHDVWVFNRPHLIVNTQKSHFHEFPISDGGSTHQAVKSKSNTISLAIIRKYTLEIHTFQIYKLNTICILYYYQCHCKLNVYGIKNRYFLHFWRPSWILATMLDSITKYLLLKHQICYFYFIRMMFGSIIDLI